MSAKKFLLSSALMSLALAGGMPLEPRRIGYSDPDHRGPLQYMDTSEFDRARLAKAAAKRARKEAKRRL